MNPTATNGFECLNTATNSNSCDIIFYDAGFIFDIPNDYSCKEQTDVLIKAVRKDDQTQRCVPGFQDKTIPVDFSFSYINPNTNSVGTLPKINNTDLNATIDLDFDSNGESHFDYLYNDAGQILITASYDNATHKAVGNDNVTSKPYGFYVYSTTPNSDANNGSNSSVFVKSGEDFNLTTSAVCWESDTDTDLSNNTVTPNYIESDIPVIHDLIKPTG
jgi:MSHA biogenesis protein MshQ